MNMDRQKGTYIKVHQHWIIGITNSLVTYSFSRANEVEQIILHAS